MLRQLVVVFGLLAVLATTACSDKGRVSAPSATAVATGEQATAKPVETPWNPIYGYDAGTTTGIAVVDSVMAEISRGDLDALASRALTFPSPCSNDQRVSSASRCPAGASPGTVIEVVHASFCAGSVDFPVTEARAIFRPLLDGFPRLWGLRELKPGNPSSKRPGAPLSRYVLFVVNNTDPPVAFTLVLGEDGRIHDVGYGCHERPEATWASWTDGVSVLSPPAAPKPR